MYKLLSFNIEFSGILGNNRPINLVNVAERVSQRLVSWANEQIGVFNTAQVNVRSMYKTTSDWHVHPKTDEMFLVLSGSVIIEIEQDSFALSENDRLIVKAGMRHRARTDEFVTLMTLICKHADL
jgi:mannose-6-phosphate isomerase-like protein (cupin superfamily)